MTVGAPGSCQHLSPNWLVSAAALTLLASQSAKANTYFWSGAANGDMSGTAANWGGTDPTSTDIAEWDSAIYAAAPNANANMSIGELRFTANNTAGVTFGATANTLTLPGVAGIGIQIDNGSGAVNTGGAKFAIDGNQTWLNNTALAKFLTVNGTITNATYTTPYNLTLDGSGTTILGGVISDGDTTGTLALIKTGSGECVMKGNNTYTGGTTVSIGTLTGTSMSAVGTNSSLSVGNGATFAYQPTTAGALNLGSGAISLANGSTIGTALGGAAGQSAITTTGTATTGGSITVNLYRIPGAAVTPGSNTLISADNGLSGLTAYTLGKVYNATDFTVGALSLTSGTLSIDTVTATPLTGEYWKGGFAAGNNIWALSDGSTASNWASDAVGTATSLTPGASATITFSASGAANQSAMVLGANTSVVGIVVADSNGIGLNADGNTLTLGTGGITMDNGAGTSVLGAAIALGAAQTWTNNSTNELTVGGGLKNGANGLTVTGTGNTNIIGAIGTGTGALTKTGSGTLTLSGLSATAANNYTGTTVINQGTLAITTTNPTLTGGITFGAASGSTSVGTLDLTNTSASFNNTLIVQTNSSSANTITLSSEKTLTLNGNVSLGTDTRNEYRSNLTVTGASGTWNVSKPAGTFFVGTAPGNLNLGAAILDMSGLGTFSANLTTGTFRVGNVGSGSGTFPSVAILATTSTITAGTLSIGEKSGTGQIMALKLGSGAQTINANNIYIGLNNGSTQRSHGSLTFNASSGSLVLRSQTDPVNGAANLLMGQNASTTGGSPTALFDVSGHMADIRLGDLKMASRNSTGAAGTIQNDTFKFDTGTLAVANQAILANNSSATSVNGNTATMTLGGGALGTGTVTFTNGLSLALNATASAKGTNANATLTIQGNTDYAFNVTSGAITMATMTGSNHALNQANATLNLLGGTLAMTGAITAGGAPTLGTATRTVNLNGGTLDMGGNNLGSATALTLNFQSGVLRNVNQINNGAALTKTTTGTLTLDGTNTYTGATLIQAGTLAVSATGTLANSPQITVGDTGSSGTILDVTAKASGLTLSGSQTLKGIGNITGSVVINGTLAPGAAIGMLTVSGSVTLAPGSNYGLEVGDWTNTSAGTGYDTLASNAVSVTATAGSKLTVKVDATGISNFSESTRSFVIASAASPPAGVTSDNWQVTATGFPGTGTWSLATSGNNLVLTYTAGVADPYLTWIDSPVLGLSAGQKGKTMDPDGDGQSNIIEFALDGNPASGAANGKVKTQVATVDGQSYLVLTLPVRSTAPAFTSSGNEKVSGLVDGVGYRIQGGIDLSTWSLTVVEVTPAITTGMPAAPDTGWTYHTFRSQDPITATPKQFLRACVEVQ